MGSQLKVLDSSLVERIVEEAKSILATRGVMIEGPMVARLKALGLDVDAQDGRLKLSPEFVDRGIASAPSSIELFDREGQSHALLEKDRVHFVPASSALKILDRKTNEMRAPNSLDFSEYVRVADGLERMSYLSTAFVPMDVPQEIADAWRLYLCYASSKQPVVSGAFTAHGVSRMGRLMSFFRSGKDELVEKPMAIFTCCPNTPLRWGEDPLQNLVECAEWGIPIEIVPVLLLGMISPSTTVGALVLHTAEVLSGLAIAQAVRPGTPILFGGAPATFHMRFMTNPMTAVEALQVFCGYAQIAKHLGVPSQAYMALSDSKFNDPQAGAETGIGAFLAALAGINSVSGPGMLDYVNCFSLEKLVFDDEICAHAQRFVRPVEIKDDLPTAELIDELLSENHLLTAEHTLEHWPEELYLPGPMVDRTNWDQWEEQGSARSRDRALEMIEDKLDTYEVDPLPEDLHKQIQALFHDTFDGDFTPPQF